MKTLTIEIPDDVYSLAEQNAAADGISLHEAMLERVAQLAGRQDDVQLDVARLNAAREQMKALFAALDQSRNDKPVGRLNREELYDRDSLR